MRLISTSEYELGFIAFGGTPTGIIAIGMFPVGVIAVGIVPMGVLSLACGAGVGVFSFSCGIAVGVRARAVGLAAGANAGAVGLPLSLAGALPERIPARVVVPPAVAERSETAVWTEVHVDHDGNVKGFGLPVELEPSADRAAQRSHGRTMHARVRRVDPDPPTVDGYREPAEPVGPRIACSALEEPARRWPLPSLAWHVARFGVVSLVVLGFLGYIANERIGITRMTRIVEATWPARPERVEGVYIDADTDCQVEARLRSDGEERLHVDVAVQCGSLSLYSAHLRSKCAVGQVAVDDGYAYTLRCSVDRADGYTDDDGDYHAEEPGLRLDTSGSPGSVRVHTVGPPPMDVTLHTDSLSQPVGGEPLLIGGRTEL